MYVALDVGGSSIKAGVVDITAGTADARPIFAGVGDVALVPLDHDSDRATLIGAFVTAIESTRATLVGRVADGIAIAVPDPFDHAHGISLMEHKFRALFGCSVGDEIARALPPDGCWGEATVRWCNDAAAAVAGEAVAGAGRNVGRVLGVTLGTGLGAAFIVDGAVVREAGGYVIPDLYAQPTPGGTADTTLSARAYVERAASGDTPESFGADLGDFLAPIVAATEAELVVVGGGGLASFDLFAPTMRERLGVPVVAAELDRWAPLIGAVALCRHTDRARLRSIAPDGPNESDVAERVVRPQGLEP